MVKPRIAVLISEEMRKNCISDDDWNRLSGFSDIVYKKLESVSYEEAIKLVENVDGILTGWGTPTFTVDMVNKAPNLKIIVHSAGSIKSILVDVKDTLKNKKIVVTSAVVSLGVGVAEFTLGMILMTMKRVWWFSELTKQGKWLENEELKKVIEPYKANIGIIGASNVGRNVIRLLKQFDVNIFVFDPYLSDVDAKNLNVTKVSLDELMAKSDVVSVHAPATEETRNMINKKHFKLMKNGAIFINTSRGSIINENDLIEELKTGRITACLDVTDPEPPAIDSPLRSLPNVILTPHIAGAVANNRLRNGNYAVSEMERFFKGEKVLYNVNLELWHRLA